MPRRSRNRARTAIVDEPKTEFGEGRIESEMRVARAEAIGSTNTVKLSKTQKSERVKELTPIEKSNGERKQKPKEPKIRSGLLSDINRALLKNSKENVPPAKQTGGRISILV
jgi:hypothetical protein